MLYFSVPFGRNTVLGEVLHFSLQNIILLVLPAAYNCALSFFLGFVLYLEALCDDLRDVLRQIDEEIGRYGNIRRKLWVSVFDLYGCIEK